MYNLKGFLSFPALADNDVDVIATLGELSKQSLTYSKEVGNYTSPQAVDTQLVSFLSQTIDEQQVAKLIKVPNVHATQALLAGQWLYTQAITGVATEDLDLLLLSFEATFQETLANTQFGQMVTDGHYWMPEWIQYELNGEDTNRVKLWLVDDSFRRQYDGYQIEFVAPIDRLDDFFLGSLQVKALVEARTVTERFEKIEEKKGVYPLTTLLSETYEYIDPIDRTWRLNTNWAFLLYGAAANNSDIIKEELVKWILDNSTHTRDEWAKIFPDIFTSTEFILTPMWGQYSKEQKTIVAGVYSPTVNIGRALAIAKQTCKGVGYTDGWITLNLSTTSFLYKSLQFLACGGSENRDGIVQFNKQFQDYMTVPFGQPDAARMSEATLGWITRMNELLIVAEEATLYSDIPLGMSRIVRDGVLYIASSYQRVLYLVVARSFLDTIDPPHLA